MTKLASEPRPRPRWRRRLTFLAASVGLVLALLACAPWTLNTRPARNWLLGKANQVLAPASLELGSLRCSWFGPTQMADFVIRDAAGDRVVSAPRATWDRNLLQILTERPRLGVLQLEKGRLDVERAEDGSIDLLEALRPILGRDPQTQLVVQVRDGSLRFRSHGMAEPLVDSNADLVLQIEPTPTPLSWTLALKRPRPSGTDRETLAITGSFDQWRSRADQVADLSVKLVGASWPWRLESSGILGTGRLDGSIEVARAKALWRSTSRSTMRDLVLTGDRLSGDRVVQDVVTGNWEVAQRDSAWDIRQFEVSGPLGALKASGSLDPEATTTGQGTGKIEGTLDLAALARSLPRALPLKTGVIIERGKAALEVSLDGGAGVLLIDAMAKVSDLAARDGERPFTLEDPATLSARLARTSAGSFHVQRLAAKTPYLDFTATGDAAGNPAKLAADFDLGGLARQLGQFLDLGGVELAGSGTLSGELRVGKEGYGLRAESQLRDVIIAGLGPVSPREDAARLDLELSGPVGSSGLPAGWETIETRASLGPTALTMLAENADARVNLALRRPLRIGDKNAVLQGRLNAHWSDAAIDLDRVDLLLEPLAGDTTSKPIRTAARGRYDRARGELVLTPHETGVRPGVLGLAPDGIRAVNVADPRRVHVELGLEGDLAALGGWLPPAYHSARGLWSTRSSIRATKDGVECDGRVTAEGLALASVPTSGTAVPEPREPDLTLTWRAVVPDSSDRLDLEELVVSSPYGTLELRGAIEDLSGARRVQFDGRTLPEWDAITRLIASRVEPGASARGHAAPIRIRGNLSGGWRESLDVTAGLSLDGADVFGMRSGPANLVVRHKAGSTSIDPIDLTLNQGRVHLEPTLDLDPKLGNVVRLSERSWIRDVMINDVVSHRVLSYVAPVFDRATRVRGSVSADIDSAVVPLAGPGDLSVEGIVAFQGVECMPGPFLDPLVNLINRADRPLVRIDEPVQLTIKDRRVYQQGLWIPIARLTHIGMEGWVDFDKNLNIVASFPILPTALADTPVIGGIAQTAIIRVPVKGTIEKPEVDKQAFDLGMKQMGKSVLERSFLGSVPGLLDLINRPRDPNAAPPAPRLTPEERRARAQQKRDDRRRRRDHEP